MRDADKRMVRMAAIALSLGRRRLAPYSSVKSRRDFTQPQLMACLVLKVAMKTDYRGLVEQLELCPALRRALGLQKVPHCTTLQKFMAREGVEPVMHAMLGELLKDLGVSPDSPVELAADSTGLQSGVASEHYRTRRGTSGKARRYVKVSVMVVCGLLVPAALVVDMGPSSGMRQMPALMEQAGARARPRLLLADRGYDAEWVHRACRERWDAGCLIPVRREAGKAVRSRYRAAQGALPAAYGRRWHAEAYFSGLKRTTLATLAGRSVRTMITEATLKVLTYAIHR